MKERNMIAVFSALACFALLSIAQAAPSPETPDPASTCAFCTADGTRALFNATAGGGTANSAFGWWALFSTTDASFSTAVGAAALILDTTGTNTAVGAGALFSNVAAANNTAIGASVLNVHAAGDNNTGIGSGALLADTNGGNNTAIGAGALSNNTVGNNNIAIGIGAGSNIATASDTICIGIEGQDVTDGCYIGHVFTEGIDPDNFIMGIDVHGKVGTHATSSGMRLTDLLRDHEKVTQLEASVAALTAQLKDQAAQLQQVNGLLQATGRANRVVRNDQ